MAGKKQISAVTMTLSEVMAELEALGTEQTKKTYINHGAREPLFGVTIGAMKPLAKKIKINRQLSEELYNTGNYDAMYFAGMIADPLAMTEADFESWIEKAYYYAISEWIVAVTLAESPLAQKISDKWIASGKDSVMSAGWHCYCWLLGSQPDSEFDKDKLLEMLNAAAETIHTMPNRTKAAMNYFITTLGVSYIPLHEQAMEAAEKIGEVYVDVGNTYCKTAIATEAIQKAIDKGRLGFKRKNVRC